MKYFVKSKLALSGGIIVLLIVGASLAAPWIAPYSIKEFTPEVLAAPSRLHLCGTDSFGRDALSMILRAGIETLSIAVLTLLCSASVGIMWGIAAGFLGGKVDRVLTTIMQGLMSFPAMMVALFMMGVFGSIGRMSLVAAISVTLMPRFAMILRGATIPAKSNEYVSAAQAIGASRWRILWRHVLPNLVTPMVVVCSINLPSIILLEASLSFLGFGAPPDAPTWGRIVSEGRQYFRIAPWLVLFPGGVIATSVIGFNLFGEGIRDILDPRVRGRLVGGSVQ